MKKLSLLFIALFAVTMIFAVSCKKDQSTPEEIKKEVSVKKPQAKAEDQVGGGETYPSGASVYPHSTGLCYCGAYSVCHPKVHSPGCLYGKYEGGVTYGCTCGI